MPARPTASNPAEFQRPGVLQLEYGFNGNWRAPGPSSEQDTPLAMYAKAGLDAKGIVTKVFEALGRDAHAETVRLA